MDFIDLTGPTNVVDEEESALAVERLQLVDENEESLDDGILMHDEVESTTAAEELRKHNEGIRYANIKKVHHTLLLDYFRSY